MGIFIKIELNDNGLNAKIARRLVTVCPVDIFGMNGEQILVRPENEDECTLCELCLAEAPAGKLTILKSYRNETLVSHGRGGDIKA